MALLFLDSFDHYATADLSQKWTSISSSGSGTVAIGSAAGRRGSNSLRFGNAASTDSETFFVQKVVAAGDATAIAGCAVLVPNNTVGTLGMALAQFKDGATVQVTLRLVNDGRLAVVRGPNTGGSTVLGTSTAAIAFGAFAYIEWKVLIHPSAGTVDVRVNGVSVLSLTGQNTRNSAASQWSSLVLGVADSGPTTTTFTATSIDYDDLYVLDGTGAAPWNTFLGDVRVDVRLPTGAGATTGFTPSTGANWQNVDDATPNGDTDYNSASSSGLTDTFVVQDAPVTGAAILGVQQCLNMKKTDASTCTVAPVIRHVGVDNVGTSLAVGTTYAYGLAVAQTNPGTGAQWTEAGFNAAEFGYKRTA